MPAATDLHPSDRIARVKTVAVVVPVRCNALLIGLTTSKAATVRSLQIQYSSSGMQRPGRQVTVSVYRLLQRHLWLTPPA